MFILFSNFSQVKILHKKGEPTTLSEKLVSGTKTSNMGTMALSSYKS